MDTKLTLRLDKSIIEQIKIYALRRQRSLSALTEELYKQKLIEDQEISSDIDTPIAKKYKGILGKEAPDMEETRLDHLIKKHLK